MTESVWSLNSVTLAGRIRPRLVNVSLNVSAGVTALMGSSGAGKSSLLGLLTDFEKPDAGSIRFHAPNSGSSLPLFWSPQDHGLWPHLSVRQHIEYVCPTKPQINRSVLEWLGMFGLECLKDSLPEVLSQGERSRLAIVRALASEASVLVLDEPMVHVDPMMAHQCWQIIDEHVRQYCSAAVFSTHHPDTVAKFAQHAICLQNGSVSFCGSVETLRFEPPTREVAWLLGPCNWFSRSGADGSCPQDALAGFNSLLNEGAAKDRAVCLRPAQLELRADTTGNFSVELIAPAATVTEVGLCDRTSGAQINVFVSGLSDSIRVGELVVLIGHRPTRRFAEQIAEYQPAKYPPIV